MAGEKYKHLFIPEPSDTQGFTNPRRGGSSPRIPTRDRNAHSRFLQGRLQAAWNEYDRQRQAVVQVEREGAYFEFVSDQGYDLVVKSLEDRRQGIRLRSVRTEGEGDNQRILATVFVPLNKRGSFLRKLNAYTTEQTRTGKPKNADLVESISDIRLAVLESFWPPIERSMIPDRERDWVELWISTEDNNAVALTNGILTALNIESADGVLDFPERTVKLILANRTELEQLLQQTDYVAEFRSAKNVATFYIDLENREQLALVQGLLGRTRYDNATETAVCILDTGVNNGHILIQPVLDNNDLHAVKPAWNTNDHDGHGTLMAGTAAYGDILSLLNGTQPVYVDHILESAKILPPPPATNQKELWGYITSQGISRAEIQAPARKRIICMAVTSDDDRDRGKPSSWSGALDELASGYEDDSKRLIIVSAGNVDDPDCWHNYPQDNLTNEVHDPGQAWNALTVGAYTEKYRIVDPTLASYSAVAAAGSLSPFSTTSTNWPPRKWPVKPEVLMEGGNVASGPNDSIIDTEDLKLISTSYQPQVCQLSPFWATSAAAGQAAWLAAQVQVQYPNAWPETIRALIVHSAQWTNQMKNQFLPPTPNKAAYARLLRICGYGVPSLERASYCLSNSLTLISEATMQPYDERFDQSGRRFVTRDMHLYNLPWPTDVLAELGETEVSMRVTLSYFIEPSPGEVGWDNRYRYTSHALRFDVNGPEESEDEFIRRVNTQARDDGEHPGTEGIAQNWLIGEARNVGSIHSDIWVGRAADLAGSNRIAVYPAVGWWRERHHLGRWNRQCRYSLVVSIYTSEEEVDIYTPVAVQLGIPIEITTRREP
ncbi:S8 family peptidase [bacterium]|nr:S8 family peptidase [bacterium]